jgi:hypothetical protein
VRLVAFMRLAELAMDGRAEFWRLLVMCVFAVVLITLMLEGLRGRGIEGYSSDAGSTSNNYNPNAHAEHSSTPIRSSQSPFSQLQPFHHMT